MTIAIALNIILAAAIFATIAGLCAWAIRTQTRDAIGLAAHRRRGFDRRTRAARPAHVSAERRRADRRYGRAELTPQA